MSVWSIDTEQLLGQLKLLDHNYYSTCHRRSWVFNQNDRDPVILSEVVEYSRAQPTNSTNYILEFFYFSGTHPTVVIPIGLQSFVELCAAKWIDCKAPQITTIRVTGIWIGIVDIFPDNTGLYFLNTRIPPNFTPPEWCTGTVEDPMLTVLQNIRA